MESDRSYGLILKHLRQLRGLSVRKLAQQIDRSVGWISEIEKQASGQ